MKQTDWEGFFQALAPFSETPYQKVFIIDVVHLHSNDKDEGEDEDEGEETVLKKVVIISDNKTRKAYFTRHDDKLFMSKLTEISHYVHEASIQELSEKRKLKYEKLYANGKAKLMYESKPSSDSAPDMRSIYKHLTPSSTAVMEQAISNRASLITDPSPKRSRKESIPFTTPDPMQSFGKGLEIAEQDVSHILKEAIQDVDTDFH